MSSLSLLKSPSTDCELPEDRDHILFILQPRGAQNSIWQILGINVYYHGPRLLRTFIPPATS